MNVTTCTNTAERKSKMQLKIFDRHPFSGVDMFIIENGIVRTRMFAVKPDKREEKLAYFRKLIAMRKERGITVEESIEEEARDWETELAYYNY